MGYCREPSSPIKICYLAHYAAGGSAVSLQTLASNLDRTQFSPMVLLHGWVDSEPVKALQAQGIPVFSLTQPRSSADAVGVPAKLKLNVTGRLSGGEWRRTLLSGYQLGKALAEFTQQDLKLIGPLRQFLREHPVDLIHLNNGIRVHRGDLLVSGWLGIPTFCHVRGFATLTPLERLAAKNVKRFFYISEAVAEAYESQKIAPDRGEIIHNVVSLPPLLTTEERLAVRAEFGWDQTHFVIVNVGRLVRWKGQDVFLKAIGRLAPNSPNLRGLIVGAADDNHNSRRFAQELEALVHEQNVTAKVIFAGFRPDALRLMAAADMVVHSATTPEPFGRVIIEGMATGTPVIGSDDGGVVEIIKHNVDGWLVKPGDDRELAEAILHLAHDAELRTRLGQAGRRRVAQDFGVDNHVRQIEQIYLAHVK